MRYDVKYGKTRMARALKMYHNEPPAGERLPLIRNYDGHQFNNRCVYVTDVQNNQVFCKSQKWFQSHEIYCVHIQNNKTVSCTCKDVQICKHMLCVEMNYQELRSRKVRRLRL